MKKKNKRFLIFTDNSYISAFLFHGVGHPPWKDIPELQKNVSYRNKMTESVNNYILNAKGEGYTRFDVHEAFPVNMMTVSGDAEIIRGVDRIIPERKYDAAVILKQEFPELSKQPRWKMIKEIRTDGRLIDEDAIIAEYLRAYGIHLLSVDSPCGLNLHYPLELKVSFQAGVDLAYAHLYPNMKSKTEDSFTAHVGTSLQLMEFYKYAGLCILSGCRCQ
jgi:hypothetical protein